MHVNNTIIQRITRLLQAVREAEAYTSAGHPKDIFIEQIMNGKSWCSKMVQGANENNNMITSYN